jgi:hypothetical protein
MRDRNQYEKLVVDFRKKYKIYNIKRCKAHGARYKGRWKANE